MIEIVNVWKICKKYTFRLIHLLFGWNETLDENCGILNGFLFYFNSINFKTTSLDEGKKSNIVVSKNVSK
jgi:hypothetical protein